MKVALFCIYGIFLCFVIGYAVFATVTFDGAIEHSYEKGMAYPQELAKLQELNWRFEPGEHQFRTGEKALLELWIKDKENNPVHDASVQFEVKRPASRETMPKQTAEEMEPGHYVTPIQVPQFGHWLVKAFVVQDQAEVEHEFRIYVEEASKPPIEPTSSVGVRRSLLNYCIPAVEGHTLTWPRARLKVLKPLLNSKG